MAGAQERVLRRRIRTVESTKKITRAMELIAASRIVRAQQAIAAARPYVTKIAEVVEHVSETPEARDHPLFRRTESAQNAAIILITADRGLAGGYNSSIVRTVERMVRDHRNRGLEPQLVTVGRKGESYFRYRRQPIMASITGVSDRPSYEDARRIVATVMEPFVAGELDQIELVFTRFVSLGSQVVTTKQLVPLIRDEQSDQRSRTDSDATSAAATATAATGSSDLPTVYEFEPEPDEILDRLLPSWLEAEVLAALLEAAASEHAARQRAMKAATDNADELIKNLRRVMNRARQDSITTEIMEIVGGAEALRQAGGDPGAGAYHENFHPAAESA
jgi:F-type H+-transporting ATPase subunit gamma